MKHWILIIVVFLLYNCTHSKNEVQDRLDKQDNLFDQDSLQTDSLLRDPKIQESLHKLKKRINPDIDNYSFDSVVFFYDTINSNSKRLYVQTIDSLEYKNLCKTISCIRLEGIIDKVHLNRNDSKADQNNDSRLIAKIYDLTFDTLQIYFGDIGLEKYYYCGHLELINSHLFAVVGYDAYELFLVDYVTTITTRLMHNNIVISSDNNRLISYGYDEAILSLSGFRLYDISHRKLEPIYFYSTDEKNSKRRGFSWDLSDVCITNESEIVFRQHFYFTDKRNPIETFAKLRIENYNQQNVKNIAR